MTNDLDNLPAQHATHADCLAILSSLLAKGDLARADASDAANLLQRASSAGNGGSGYDTFVTAAALILGLADES